VIVAMATPTCAVQNCNYPSPDGRICWTCTTHLRKDLTAALELADELAITITKQDRISDGGRRARGTIPLPYRPDAAEVAWVYQRTLASWVRILDSTQARYATSTAALAEWLTARLDVIRRDPLAGELVDEIAYATCRAFIAIDRPPTLAYLGPCSCSPDARGRPVEIYARPNAVEATCRGCNETYTVADRREWLLKRAEDQLLTAAECSRALPNLLQRPLTAAMVRGYARRGRLTPRPAHPLDPRHDPRYRVGDVLDVLSRIPVPDPATPKAS
jgi:hypothetical protein